MAKMKRQPWTEGDNEKLRNLAGTTKVHAIARDLERTVPAVVMQAVKEPLSNSLFHSGLMSAPSFRR